MILICFKNKFLNTTKVAIAVMMAKCPTPATRQERLVWEVQSQREFVVRVLGREVLAPPCASWLTRHPERAPLPPPPPPPPPHHHYVLKVKCCFFRSWHKFVGPLSKGACQKRFSGFCPLRGSPPPYPLNGKSFC